uniref:Cupin-like domain-containing protein n=1 Tax=Strigamia maritima TaxID=126957 RepID=T1JIM1_STRMM
MSKKLRSDVSLLFELVVKKAVALGIDETIVLLWFPNLQLFHGLAQIWLTNSELHLQPCTINMPVSIQNMFRPPVDCSMCRDVYQVDRVSAISVADFKKRYAYTGHPVVITDSTSNWTALKHFNFPFFKSLYSDDSPTLESIRQGCQFFPYDTEFKSLGEVFNMNAERALLKDKSKPWYIGWSNCDSSVANALRKHYERPYFLPADAESSKTDWVFMGSPGYGAHLHIDHVVNPSWQAQISGHKHWTLEPPPECSLDCRGLEVTVEPGEIIVLDTNWWFHKTLIVGEEISITIGSEYD